ncbi:hypothetical protein ACFLYA_01275 [Candidatus Dependentiae bacterium]
MKKIIILSMLFAISSPVFTTYKEGKKKVYTLADLKSGNIDFAKKYLEENKNSLNNPEWWEKAITELLPHSIDGAKFLLEQAVNYLPKNATTEMLQKVIKFLSTEKAKKVRQAIIEKSYNIIKNIAEKKKLDLPILNQLRDLLYPKKAAIKKPFSQKFKKAFIYGVTVINGSGKDLKVQICPGIEKRWTEIKNGQTSFLKIEKERFLSPEYLGKKKIIIRWKSSTQKEDIYWETEKLDYPQYVNLSSLVEGIYAVESKKEKKSNVPAKEQLKKDLEKLSEYIKKTKSEEAKELADKINYDFENALHRALDEFDLTLALWILRHKKPVNLKTFQEPLNRFIQRLALLEYPEIMVEGTGKLSNFLNIVLLFYRNGIKPNKKELLKIRKVLTDSKAESNVLLMDGYLEAIGYS